MDDARRSRRQAESQEAFEQRMELLLRAYADRAWEPRPTSQVAHEAVATARRSPRLRGQVLLAAAVGLLAVGMLSALLFAAARPPDRSALPDESTLRRHLEQAVVRANVPGASVAVLGPRGRWTAVAGMADLESGRAMTTDTVFTVAGVTTTVVAAVVMDLVSEGVISLDDFVADDLPSAPVGDRTTVRHLLSHTSGLSDPTIALASMLDAEPERTWTADEFLSHVQGQRCAVGTCFHYSNTNYILLGQLVEAVTGRPVHDALRARVFEPLGLERVDLQGPEGLAPPRARGHQLGETAEGFEVAPLHGPESSLLPTRSWATATWTAGAMAGTAEDLAILGHALFRGELIDPWAVAQMTRPVSPSPGETEDDYGLGAWLGRGDRSPVGQGRPVWYASGEFPGFGAVMAHFPGADTTVTVLLNVDGAPYMDAVGGSVIDLVVGRGGRAP